MHQNEYKQAYVWSSGSWGSMDIFDKQYRLSIEVCSSLAWRSILVSKSLTVSAVLPWCCQWNRKHYQDTISFWSKCYCLLAILCQLSGYLSIWSYPQHVLTSWLFSLSRFNSLSPVAMVASSLCEKKVQGLTSEFAVLFQEQSPEICRE